MSLLLKAIVRDGRVELGERIDLPDGTEILLTAGDWSESEAMTEREIATTLASMERLQPLEIHEELEKDLSAWEHQLNQRGINHVDRSAEDVFR